MVRNGIYLLDTNIVSECAKISPNPKIAEKLDVFAQHCRLSTISWYEIQKGIKRLLDGKKKGFLTAYADEQIAATALAFDLVLVTRNVKDFEGIASYFSLKIENRFD